MSATPTAPVWPVEAADGALPAHDGQLTPGAAPDANVSVAGYITQAEANSPARPTSGGALVVKPFPGA